VKALLQNREKATVEFVVQKKLCTSCGACAGACGPRAIRIELNRYGSYTPIIDQERCTKCGVCVRVCPGVGYDYYSEQLRVFGKLPEHDTLGSFLDIYAGYTNDEDILERSQSGGFVSALLIFCLEKGLIDGAVVSRWRKDKPLCPETYIARSREEILDAVGSKYNPIPAAEALGLVLREKGRFAFVGTSCQIQGMRKAEAVLPKLSEKIALYIGLHCLGVFTFHFHDHVLHKAGVRRQDLTFYRQRDKRSGGWPCGTRLCDKTGKEYLLDPNNSRLWPRPYYTNWRCYLCFDKGNEFSDVSCGDCRIPEQHQAFEQNGYDLKRGLSEFVVRTERAKKIIDQAVAEGIFHLHKETEDAVARSIGIAGKKLGINTFRRVSALFRSGIPEYGVYFEHIDKSRRQSGVKTCLISLWSVVSSSRFYLFYRLLSWYPFRWIMMRIPNRTLNQWNKRLDSKVEWKRHGFSVALKANPTATK